VLNGSGVLAERANTFFKVPSGLILLRLRSKAGTWFSHPADARAPWRRAFALRAPCRRAWAVAAALFAIGLDRSLARVCAE